MVINVYDPSTRSFIDDNPCTVVFQRRERVKVAGGGYQWRDVGDPLPVQRGRLVFRGNVSDTDRRTLPDGRVVTVQATIVLMSNGDVQESDIATVNGARKWEVVNVIDRFDTRAEVIRYAGT